MGLEYNLPFDVRAGRLCGVLRLSFCYDAEWADLANLDLSLDSLDDLVQNKRTDQPYVS